MRKLYLFILVAVLLGACVSTNAPNNLNRAKKRVGKHYQGIKNIVAKHPGIADSTKRVVRGELIIPSVKNETTGKVAVDTTELDALLREYARVVYDSLMNMASRGPEDIDFRPKQKPIKPLLNQVRNKIIESVSDSLGTFVFEDGNIKIERSITAGEFRLKYEIKEQKAGFDQTIIETNLDPCPGPSTWDKVVTTMGHVFLFLLLCLVGIGIVNLYLKFKPL